MWKDVIPKHEKDLLQWAAALKVTIHGLQIALLSLSHKTYLNAPGSIQQRCMNAPILEAVLSSRERPACWYWCLWSEGCHGCV